MNALTDFTIPQDLDDELLNLVPPPAKKRSKKVIVLLLVIVATFAALAIAQYLRTGSAIVSTDDAQLNADFVQISSKLSGKIAAVNVIDNQHVTRGQVLFELDPADTGLAVEGAKIQSRISEDEITVSKAALSEAFAQVREAQAELTAAVAEADYAKSEAKRLGALAATGAESRARLQQAQLHSAKSQSGVTAKQALLQAANAKIVSIRAHQKQLQDEVAAASVTEKTTQLRLADTKIIAPADGWVKLSDAQVGEVLQSGQALARIIPSNKLYVVANYKETQVSNIRPGQKATISVDALPGVELDGAVLSLAHGTGAAFSLLPQQNATGNFTRIVQRIPVLIQLSPRPDLGNVLVPGMSLGVRIDTSSTPRSVNIPGPTKRAS